jgi:hypothetical protein
MNSGASETAASNATSTSSADQQFALGALRRGLRPRAAQGAAGGQQQAQIFVSLLVVDDAAHELTNMLV